MKGSEAFSHVFVEMLDHEGTALKDENHINDTIPVTTNVI